MVGSRLYGLLTRDYNYFNNTYISGALSPEAIISGVPYKCPPTLMRLHKDNYDTVAVYCSCSHLALVMVDRPLVDFMNSLGRVAWRKVLVEVYHITQVMRIASYEQNA